MRKRGMPLSFSDPGADQLDHGLRIPLVVYGRNDGKFSKQAISLISQGDHQLISELILTMCSQAAIHISDYYPRHEY